MPPTVRSIHDHGLVSARQGSTVNLECKASGNPVPTVHWFRKVIDGFMDDCFMQLAFLLRFYIFAMTVGSCENNVKFSHYFKRDFHKVLLLSGA